MRIFALILSALVALVLLVPVSVVNAAGSTGSPLSTPPPLTTAKVNAGAATTVKPTTKS